MNSVIGAIVGIIALLGAGRLTKAFYYQMKEATIVKVHYGLSPLGEVTKKLTRQKLER